MSIRCPGSSLRRLPMAALLLASWLLPAHAAHAYLTYGDLFGFGDYFPNKWGAPTVGTGATVTWGFMADGTDVDPNFRIDPFNYPHTSGVVGTSNISQLRGSIDTNYGTGAFDGAIQRSLATWSAAANINFMFVATDSGLPVNNPGATTPQIRIGAFMPDPNHSFKNSAAVGFAPPPNGGTLEGDVLFNLAAGFQIAPGAEDVTPINFFFGNDLEGLALHEIGHTLGFDHPNASDPHTLMDDVMRIHFDTFNDPYLVNRQLSAGDKGGVRHIYGLRNPLKGDVNSDSSVNSLDIAALSAALANLPEFQWVKGVSHSDLRAIADLDGNTIISNADLQSLLNYLNGGGGSGTQAVPEPATGRLLFFGMLLAGWPLRPRGFRNPLRLPISSGSRRVFARRHEMRALATALVLAMVLVCGASSASAINLVLDYTHDSFFNTRPTAKAALEAAAANISTAITSSLAATVDMNSSTVNGSTATFDFDFQYTNPVTNVTEVISSAVVPANQVRIFVGVRNITNSAAGVGGPGGAGVAAGGSFLNPSDLTTAVGNAATAANANMRRGGGPTIGTLNGSLAGNSFSIGYGSAFGNLWLDMDSNNDGAMDSDAALNNYWQFDHTAPVSAGKLDFYSVALHETLHALGVGTSQSWEAKVSAGDGRDWLGSQVIGLLGTGDNVLAADSDHVANALLSTRIADGGVQEAVMDPSLLVGTRKTLTRLDLAFLRDIGWETMAYPYLLGDFNQDNRRTAADIQAMLTALANLNAYKSTYALSDTNLLAVGDLNGDLVVSNSDLQGLLNLLKGGGGALQGVPEPGSLFLIASGFVLFIWHSRLRRRST